MRRGLTALSASAVYLSVIGVAIAHHSFAMFDQEQPSELEGTVQEFKYTSPHTFILLVVKDKDGESTVWNLEGGAQPGQGRVVEHHSQARRPDSAGEDDMLHR